MARLFSILCALAAIAASAAGIDGRTAADLIRVEADAAPRRVYVGERVTVTYRLVTPAPRAAPETAPPDVAVPPAPPSSTGPEREDPDESGVLIRDIRVLREPRFPNFWASEIQTETDDPARDRGVYPLRRIRLFPVTAGRLAIEPAVFGMRVFPDTLETADDGPQTIVCETGPLQIDVLPLPEQGKPETFGGATGQFAIAAVAAAGDVRAGQVTRIEIEVRGDGNVETAGGPYLPSAAGARVMAPRRLSADLGLSSADGLARAVWVVDVIPERPGPLAIGPFALDFFNPRTRTYETARSNVLNLTALDRVAPPPFPTREPGSRFPWPRIVAALAVVFVGAGLGVAFVRGLFGNTARAARPAPSEPPAREGDPAVLAHLRVRLKRAIVLAEEARRAGDGRSMHAQLFAALGDLAATLYDLPPAALTRERLAERLASRGLPAALVERAIGFHDGCQTASFSPAAPETSRAPVEEAVRLFEDLARRAQD